MEDESETRMMSTDKEVLIIPPVTDKNSHFNNETIGNYILYTRLAAC